MTSKIKVDNINKVSDDSNIIKKCGTTTTIGSGASNPIVVDGSAITLGRCGGTVALASGATQTGFGRTGTVDWDTTPKTATFSAVSGNGYFCNTSGGAFTVNLPAGSAGAIVSLADYAATWQTNNLTVSPNGTDKIGSVNSNVVLNTEGQSVTFVFVDSTQGWVNTMDSTSNVRGNSFICASVSGACNTLTTAPCCANVKIATFTGPGTFTVNTVSVTPAENTVGYLVIAAGAGGGGSGGGGGGGAGGFREGRNVPIDNFTASPLVANAPTNAVTLTAQAYPITVGAGGAGGTGCACSGGGLIGINGANSIFSTITSAGGGGGGTRSSGGPQPTGSPGGNGGGNGRDAGSPNGGAGNTPPVSPPQGNNGGGVPGTGSFDGGGGGGANGGGQAGALQQGGAGGAGMATSITGSAVTRAGGGGGGSDTAGDNGAGGSGGGGTAGRQPGTDSGNAGTINTGSGGGGSGELGTGGAGGSGIVIIRYKFQ
jgi:hypothetical protein